MPNLTHTLDQIYLTDILLVQCLQTSLHNYDNHEFEIIQIPAYPSILPVHKNKRKSFYM